MNDEAALEGEVLLDMNERRAARFVLGYGIALSVAGIVPAILGYYWWLLTLAALPLFIWMSRQMASKRLLLTTNGIRYERGPRARVPQVFAAWSTIKRVSLEVERGRNSDGKKTYDHYLVVDHGEPKPIRYLFGSRPSDELLKQVGRICRDHEVAVVLNRPS